MAITTDSDLVICVAPELKGQETRIDKFIPHAINSVSESIWGAKAEYAVALLTAHMLTIFNRRGIGGEVKRKKLGNSEVEYGIQLSGEKEPHELSTTSYGKEFLRCRSTLVLSPLVASC